MSTKQTLWQFVDELAARAEYWRTTENDPHGMATAVYVALAEEREAWTKVLRQNFGERHNDKAHG